MFWGVIAAICFVTLVVCMGKKTDNLGALQGIVASLAGLAISFIGIIIA
jgi:hypothetical protein